MAIRYVNTASTAGGDGTTNATTGANRAYASLNEWEAARQAVLSEIEECICEGTAADTTAVVIDGWTTTASYYIYIHTTQANRHDGKWNATKYRISAGHAISMDIFESFVRQSGLQYSSQFNYATSGVVINIMPSAGGAADIRIENFILREISPSYSDNGIRLEYVAGINTTTVVRLKNGIIYDISKANRAGIETLDDYTLYAYNITTHNCAYGFNGGGVAAFNAKNCGAAASLTAGFTGTITQTTCSSTTPTFVDVANDDFHLASSDTTWRNVGTDLSGDANYPFSDDIDGQTRSGSWDIGADEYVAAGGAKFPVPHIWWSEA